MGQKLLNFILYYGYEKEQMQKVRRDVVRSSIRSMRIMGIVLAAYFAVAFCMHLEERQGRVDLAYVLTLLVFLLVTDFGKNWREEILEAVSILFAMMVLSVAIWDSTYYALESMGIYFPIILLIYAALFTGSPLVGNGICIMCSTSFIWLSGYVKNPIYAKTDETLGLFALFVAITLGYLCSRTRIAGILEHRESMENDMRHLLIYDNLPCGVFQFRYRRDKIHFKELNKVALNLLDYPKSSLKRETGWNLEDFILEKDIDNFHESILRLQQPGDDVQCELRIKSRDGSVGWVSGRMLLVADRDGWKHILCAASYVDEQKAAEKEIRALGEKYRSLYETVPCGIFELRIRKGKEKFLNINRKGLEILGYTSEEFWRKEDWSTARMVHKKDLPKLFSDGRRLQHVGDSIPYEYRMKRSDGSYIWVIGEVHVTDVGEDSITILNACLDINDAKRAMDANAAKSRFLSRMSHEIRTPINALMGLNELSMQELERETFNKEKLINYAMESANASKYLLTLLNDILDISMIENNRVVLKQEVLDIPTYMKNIVALITPAVEKKKISFTWERLTHFSDLYVGDRVRIQQILMNLLNNAVKFTPEGGSVKITMEAIKHTKRTTTLQFIVKDTGIGMSREFQKKLFEPFTQEDGENTSPYEGTGIGLAISYQLAKMMHGNITCKSDLNRGTTFTLTFEVGNFDHIQYRHLERRKRPRRRWDFSTARILVCEDHPLNQKIIKNLLENKGCIVDIAENGRIGVDMFRRSPDGYYALILMDIRMPVMDGLEATRQIRAFQRGDALKIPIIAMTANAYDEDIEKSFNAGMNKHLAKPVDAEILYDAIEQYLFEEH